MELRLRRRVFVNRALGLDLRLQSLTLASQATSSITYNGLRHQLFVGSEARFFYMVLFRLLRLVLRNRSLPCFIPYEGAFTY